MAQHNLFALAQQYTRTQRNLVQRTVETYSPHWLAVHETLQNAIDAIQQSDKDEGKVTINLDIANNRVVTRDNGRGFPHEMSLLLMGGGDKADDPEAWKYGGNQGVGLKAVYFSSNLFRVESVVNGRRWGAAIENGHRYMTQDITLTWDDKPESVNHPNGTQVLVEFPGSEVADFLNTVYRDYYHLVPDALAASPAEKLRFCFEYYFRSYSYAGDVNHLLGLPGLKPVTVTLTISTEPDSLPDELDDELAALLVENLGFEVSFPAKHWDVKEIVTRIDRRRRRPRILETPLENGRIGRWNPHYIWVREMTSPDEYRSLLLNPHMYKPPEVESYQSFFDKVSGIYIVVGKPERLREVVFEGPRRFIAANGIPSAHSIHTPSGIGALGYVANIHMVVNVKANMNYGKQTITNTWLVGEVNRFFKDSFRSTLKNVAEGIVGRVEGGSSAEDLTSDEEDTDILARPRLPLTDLSFKREPRDENGVIAMFFELLGRGDLVGYHVYSLSQKARYDGKAVIKLTSQSEVTVPRTDASLRSIEFKLKLRPLIAEFSDYVKDSSDVTLIVIWEDDFSDGDTQHPDFQVIGIEHTAQADQRMDGVTKILLDARNGKEIQMLVLKEVIEQIASEGTAA
ncbi:MAG: hypothetical protein ACOC6F_02080 [bacterium]